MVITSPSHAVGRQFKSGLFRFFFVFCFFFIKDLVEKIDFKETLWEAEATTLQSDSNIDGLLKSSRGVEIFILLQSVLKYTMSIHLTLNLE